MKLLSANHFNHHTVNIEKHNATCPSATYFLLYRTWSTVLAARSAQWKETRQKVWLTLVHSVPQNIVKLPDRRQRWYVVVSRRPGHGTLNAFDMYIIMYTDLVLILLSMYRRKRKGWENQGGKKWKPKEDDIVMGKFEKSTKTIRRQLIKLYGSMEWYLQVKRTWLRCTLWKILTITQKIPGIHWSGNALYRFCDTIKIRIFYLHNTYGVSNNILSW